MPKSIQYPGHELELFQTALNWKNYYAYLIMPYIKGNVLEVGAGLGANNCILNKNTEKWVLLEPDSTMAAILQKKIDTHILPDNCVIVNDTIFNLNHKGKFDTIIYIDVLEHIKDDESEIHQTADLLAPGGHLVILSPAFNCLYSPFDKAIGHFRRYTKSTLRQLIPGNFLKIRLSYLDSLGFCMSLTNRLLLRQDYPTQKQVKFWDKYLISISKMIDSMIFYSFGKAILGVWQKPVTDDNQTKKISR